MAATLAPSESVMVGARDEVSTTIKSPASVSIANALALERPTGDETTSQSPTDVRSASADAVINKPLKSCLKKSPPRTTSESEPNSPGTSIDQEPIERQVHVVRSSSDKKYYMLASGVGDYKFVPQTQTPPSSTSTNGTPPQKPSQHNPEPWRRREPHIPQPRARQLYAPNRPLYTPAALRPTEPPVKHSPPKHGVKAIGKVQSGPPTPPGTADSEESDHEAFQKGLDEVEAKSKMTRNVADEWRVLEPATGAPTTQHWKPDTAATVCDFAACEVEFNFFNRRHHCRRCGLIFCAEHSNAAVPLDHYARLNPRGYPSRACTCCKYDYQVWEMYRKNRPDDSNKSSEVAIPKVDASTQTAEHLQVLQDADPGPDLLIAEGSQRLTEPEAGRRTVTGQTEAQATRGNHQTQNFPPYQQRHHILGTQAPQQRPSGAPVNSRDLGNDGLGWGSYHGVIWSQF